MKLKNRYWLNGLRSLVLVFFLFSIKSYSQCGVTINASVNPSGNGQVSFSSVISGTIGVPSYTWTFGAPGISSLTGTMWPNPTVTYSASGFYVVHLTITTGTCTATHSISIGVPVCSMSFTQTATTGTLCTGSATPIISGLCSPLNYSWSSGHTVMVDTSMCAQVYTLTVTGATNSPICCASIQRTVSILSNTTCLLNASFKDTLLTNGLVSFTSTSTGVNAQTSYTWDFGDGSNPLIGINYTQVVNAYTNNTIHFAKLYISHNGIPSCMDSTTKAISITNYSPCLLNPQYQASVSGSTVTFVSTSTGTNSSSIYTWHFGDGSTSPPSMSPTVAHTYTSTGVFNTMLAIDNTSTIPMCMDSSAIKTVTVFPCTLAADFNYVLTGPKTLVFNSTSTATTSLTSYSWNFGDGQNGSGSVVMHNYSTGGVYTVTLHAENDTFCKNNKSKTVVIDTTPCLLNAVFLHTVGASGVVQYSAVTTGSVYDYFWDFGDGTSAIVPSPTHTYVNGGNHYVTLIVSQKQKAFCGDTLTLAINITGIPCVANSGFSLMPTGTPKYWSAIPSYPYNITAATWSWGDGTSASTLFTSHTYSAAAQYSICLSVTVSCGATSTTCGNYNIYKTSGGADLYFVNVVAPPLQVAIAEESLSELTAVLYPNPTQGVLNVSLGEESDVTYVVQDLAGRLLLVGDLSKEKGIQINLSALKSGLYLVELRAGTRKKTSRIILNE